MISVLAAVLVGALLAQENPTAPLAAESDTLKQTIAEAFAKPILSERSLASLLQLVEAALVRNPNDAELRLHKAEILDRQNRTAEATAIWQKLLDGLSDAPQHRAVRARAAQHLGNLKLVVDDTKGAVALARKSIELAPTDVRGYQLLSDASLRGPTFAECLDTLRHAADAYGKDRPEFTAAYFDLLTRTGDLPTLRERLKSVADDASIDADVQHYRGVLAESNGDELEAFARHFLAVELGSGDRPTIVRSKDFLSEVTSRDEQLLKSDVLRLVQAYLQAGRAATSAQALEVLKTTTGVPTTASVETVENQLRATALAALGKFAEASQVWQAIVKRWPAYSPALCGEGECLEVTGKADEAEALFEKARQLAPSAPRVRRIFRLGAKVRATPAGVKVIAIEKTSPLVGIGIGPGCEIVQLDRDVLTDYPPFERLQMVRLFFGGIVHYRDAQGAKIAKDMDLIYFKN